MVRSVWKGPNFDSKVFEKVMKSEKYHKIKVWSRGATILSDYIGHNFEVHNGRSFSSIEVVEGMVGHKFGEFASTRTAAKKNKKKRK